MAKIDIADYVWPLLVCPQCNFSLSAARNQKTEGEIVCPSCAERFPVIDGIPHLFAYSESEIKNDPQKITLKQKTFYEDIAFPNYAGCETPALLLEKARSGVFAANLDKSIPMGAMVLEVGCGTGQLTNYLGMNYKRVIGCDMSTTSLKLGKSFRDTYDIHNTNFVQGNIFTLPFKDESFDVVICTGVLHHTHDAYEGFKRVLRLVKPNGFILIGLYNTYGRIATKSRQVIFGLNGFRMKFLDVYARRKMMDGAKLRAWLLDQYRNPHETAHSVRELLGWYRQNGVMPLAGVPTLSFGDEYGPDYGLFDENPIGDSFELTFIQMGWIFSLGSEGGLFAITGKKTNGINANL